MSSRDQNNDYENLLGSNIQHTGEITVKEFVLKLHYLYHYLIAKWIFILSIGIVGGIVGYVYASIKEPVYVADSTFVLEEEGGSSALGQYANLASVVGISTGGANGGIFQGDNLLELYKSRTMLEKTLLTEILVDGKKSMLVDRYVNFNNLKEKWAKNEKLDSFKFNSNNQVRSRLQDSLISSIILDLNKNYLDVNKLDKRPNVIRVEVKSKDEIFSKLFNDQIVQNVNDFYVQTKTKKALQNLYILQHQTDSIKGALNGAISGVALSLDANPNVNPSRQILRVPSQKRQIDAEANKAILTQLVTNLEISKVSLRKETPLIQVIDTPVFPLEKKKPSKLVSLIIGGFLGCFLTISFLILRRVFNKVMY